VEHQATGAEISTHPARLDREGVARTGKLPKKAGNPAGSMQLMAAIHEVIAAERMA
jgi:hypothetical protein